MHVLHSVDLVWTTVVHTKINSSCSFLSKSVSDVYCIKIVLKVKLEFICVWF